MKRKRRSERGFSTIETLAAMAFLGATMIPLLGSMHKSMDSHHTMTTRDQVEERARKLSQRVKHYLREAPAELLDTLPAWPLTTHTISYDKAESFDKEATLAENVVIERAESLTYQNGELWLTSGPSTLLLASGLKQVGFCKDGNRIVAVVSFDEKGAGQESITVTRKFHVYPQY